MKEFAVYNLLRLVLLAVWLCIVFGVWALVDNSLSSLQVLVGLLVAAVGSGISSWYMLAPQREALAARIGQGASRAASKYEEMRKAPGEE